MRDLCACDQRGVCARAHQLFVEHEIHLVALGVLLLLGLWGQWHAYGVACARAGKMHTTCMRQTVGSALSAAQKVVVAVQRPKAVHAVHGGRAGGM